MAYSATQFQLTHLLQRVYRKLGGTYITTATSGSTTTAADTKLVDVLGDGNTDDAYNGGTVIVIKDADGAAAAPEGEFSRVSDYTASTFLFTLNSTLTAAVASGDTFLFTTQDYPLTSMIEIVNDALSYLGDIPILDTSITTASQQTEYTLPVAVKRENLLRVEIQGQTDDANDNQWVDIPNFRIAPAVAGSAGTLIIPQYASGYTVRLTYLGIHPRVSAYADPIAEIIHPDLAVACVVAHALEWINVQQGATEERIQRENKAWNDLDRALMRHPIYKEPRRIQGFPHWENSSDDDFPEIPLA